LCRQRRRHDRFGEEEQVDHGQVAAIVVSASILFPGVIFDLYFFFLQEQRLFLRDFLRVDAFDWDERAVSQV
jgi:hypothetical protein